MTEQARRIGRYAVQGVIGSGGFGTVHLGVDPVTGERVAIKVLDWPQEGWRRQMFRDEVAALLSVDHPNVVRVRDVIDTPDLAALVTDFVEGASLREVLRRNGPLDAQQSLSVLWGALNGLAAVHAAGLVHADLKPENILLDGNGASRLIDFGLTAPPRALNGPDTWIGTPAYLAPEVVLGTHIDHRSDIYAAAVILFELLCGRTPYVGPNPVMTALLHVQSAIPDPRRINQAISASLADLCVHDLAKDPRYRHQASTDFLANLNDSATQTYGAHWAAAGAGLGTLVATTLAALPGSAAGFGMLGAAPVAAPAAAAAAAALGGGVTAVGGALSSGLSSAISGTAAASTAGAGAAGGSLAGSAGSAAAAGSISGAAGGVTSAAGASGAGTAGSGAFAAIGGAKGAVAAASVFAVVAAGAGAAILLTRDDPTAAPSPAAASGPAVLLATWQGEVHLVRTDGSNTSLPLDDFSDGSTVSADGKWLVGVNRGDLDEPNDDELLVVSTADPTQRATTSCEACAEPRFDEAGQLFVDDGSAFRTFTVSTDAITPADTVAYPDALIAARDECGDEPFVLTSVQSGWLYGTLACTSGVSHLLVDPATGEVRTLAPPAVQGEITDVAVSPDGRYVAGLVAFDGLAGSGVSVLDLATSLTSGTTQAVALAGPGGAGAADQSTGVWFDGARLASTWDLAAAPSDTPTASGIRTAPLTDLGMGPVGAIGDPGSAQAPATVAWASGPEATTTWTGTLPDGTQARVVDGALLIGDPDNGGKRIADDIEGRPLVVLAPTTTGAAPAQPAAADLTEDAINSAPVPGVCGHSPGTLVNGTWPGAHNDPPDGAADNGTDWGYVDLKDVEIGDLNADGVADAAARISCSQGGVGWPDYIVLYSATPSGPQILGSYNTSTITNAMRNGVSALTYADGAVTVTAEKVISGGGCCPVTEPLEFTLRWNGVTIDVG